MFNCQLKIQNKNDTRYLATALSKILEKGIAFCLIGTLGVGKTYLAREIIKNLYGRNIKVNSPTFNIISVYQKPHLTLWHVDLYRISNEEEVTELGLEEALQNYALIIEWADKLTYYYPKNAITIKIEFDKHNPAARIITVSSSSKPLLKPLTALNLLNS